MHRPRHVTGILKPEGNKPAGIPLETLFAGILAALLAVPSPLSASMSWGSAITLALAPVTLPALWRDQRARWLVITIIALVPSGWLVAQVSLLQDPGRTFNIGVFLYEAALPVGLLGSLLGPYWCITKLGLQRFLTIFFCGLLAATPILSPKFHDNAWKYGLAVPVSMLAILLFARKRLTLGLIITPFLAGVSIAADLRSWVGFLALSAILTMYAPRSGQQPSKSRVATLGVVTSLSGFFIIWLITQAATAGVLGAYLEQRTRNQIEAGNGNLILGGRPEWGAAIAMWRANPLGIGIGVAPSPADYWLAIRSMPLSVQGQEEITDVAVSFRRGVVSFHSTFWTFWGIYGAAGVLFAALAVFFMARAMLTATAAIQSVSLRGAATLLLLSSIWDIFFTPTAVPQFAVALATALYILCDSAPASVRTKDSAYERSPTHQRHYNYTQ